LEMKLRKAKPAGRVLARGYVSDHELPFRYELTVVPNEPECKRRVYRVEVREVKGGGA